MTDSQATFIHGVLESLDCDFPFGANDPSEKTTIVTESERLTWRDVEALRVKARADVATVADAHWTRALSYVARLKVPCVRTWAARWLSFCTVPGSPRPPRHIGEAGKACRRVELALARLGVVDPEGFEAVEHAARGASKSRAKRKRQNRGGDCNGLREYRERMEGPWIG